MPNNELYSRQQELQLTVPHHVTVAGVGGIGSWVGIYCAMSGVENIYLFDPDVMEESNRNRLPFCEGSLNRPKVEVVRDYIMSIRPEANVLALQDKLEGLLLRVQINASDYIIDCTDSPRAQITMYNACKAASGGGNGRVRYIRAGYDGTRMTVTSHVSGWIRSDAEEEHYIINPSWVVPASVVAALAVGKMMKYPEQEVSLDLSEIGIPVRDRQRRLTARCNQQLAREQYRRR